MLSFVDVHRPSLGHGLSSQVLPPLCLICLLKVLREMGITVRVSDEEADADIASISKAVERALVISQDSDFFIFDLGSAVGYMPLQTLELIPGGTGESYLQGRVYTSSKIADHFCIPSEYLPLFASVVGNDYSQNLAQPHQQEFQDLVASSNRIRGTASLIQTSIQSAPLSLSPCQICQSIASPTLSAILEASMDQYALDSLPSRAPLAFQTAQIHHKLLDVLFNQIFYCTPFLEDSSRTTTWDKSAKIRIAVYETLFGRFPEFILAHVEELSLSAQHTIEITEQKRRGNHVSIDIFTITSRPWSSSCIEDNLTFFLTTLHADTDKIRSLPPDLIGISSCLRYFLASCSSVKDFELQGLLVMALFHQHMNNAPPCTSFSGSDPNTPMTRSTLHLVSLIQSCLVCTEMLIQVLDLSLSISIDPSRLDAGVFHTLLPQIKTGKSVQRILGLDRTGVFTRVYDAIVFGFENKIEIVVGHKSKRQKTKKRKIVLVSPGNGGYFDVLSSGCTF